MTLSLPGLCLVAFLAGSDGQGDRGWGPARGRRPLGQAHSNSGSGGSIRFTSSPVGPDLSLVDAVLARSWAGVLEFDLFDAASSVPLNSSDCIGHCNRTCDLPPGWVQVSPAGQV